MSTPKPLSVEQIVPGGIRPTDHWHRGMNDNTCSRCREEVPEEDVPLLFWKNDGHDLLIYCEACLGVERRASSEKED